MSTPEQQRRVSDLLREQSLAHPGVVIVELGAHTGEESTWMSVLAEASAAGRCIVVEPDLVNCQAILDSALGPFDLIIGAVSDHTGWAQFYPAYNTAAKNRASGSTRKPTGHLHHFPEVEFNGTTMVPCYTLDAIAEREQIDHIDLLWVDIQGAERDMIQGGRATLAKTRYMMIEAEEVEMYEGQALKPELLAMLPEWEVLHDWGYDLLMRNKEYKCQ